MNKNRVPSAITVLIACVLIGFIYKDVRAFGVAMAACAVILAVAEAIINDIRDEVRK